MAFARQPGMLLALPLAIAVLLLASACDSGEDQAERRHAIQTLVDAIRLEPVPDETAITIDETSSKADAAYYTARGTLPGERGTVVTLLEHTLRDQGSDAFESTAVDYSLG